MNERPEITPAVRDRALSRFAADPETGCWNWQHDINKDGYGKFSYYGFHTLAHRVVYRLLHAEIPDGLQLDHLCFNKRCVNPAHLEPVTSRENHKRRTARQTHCIRGHEFSGDNLLMINEHRHCRACNRIRDTRSRINKRGRR